MTGSHVHFPAGKLSSNGAVHAQNRDKVIKGNVHISLSGGKLNGGEGLQV